MTREQALRIVEKASVDANGRKRLSCARAFQISRKHRLSRALIGRLCAEGRIKIVACQWGCFK